MELNVATGVSTRLGDLIRDMVAAVGYPELPVHPEDGAPGDVSPRTASATHARLARGQAGLDRR